MDFARLNLTRWAPFSLLLVACGGASTVRMVDVPTGSATEYGGPRERSFVAELDAAYADARVVVYETSRCDVIPVTVMQRYEERRRGDEILQRTPVTKKQVAGEPKGSIPCNQTFARNVEVFVEADGTRVSLGATDARGRVVANLARVFQVGSYEQLPKKMSVLLRTQQAEPARVVGELELSQLVKFGERVRELLAQLEAILAKGEQGQSPADITRSYELYSQLQEIAAEDPRVEGIRARFWELYYGRKQEESREKLGRNLAALAEAKDTLKVMGDAAIPLYVQAAVNSSTLDPKALEWSSLRLIRALRSAPVICGGGFQFGRVPTYGWPADARLAAQYVNYGYGDAFLGAAQRACAY